MADKYTIISTHPTGEELFQVWAAVEPVLEGFPVNVVIPALLAICFTAQDSEIDDDKLREGVKGAGQWIALYLSEDKAKESMN